MVSHLEQEGWILYAETDEEWRFFKEPYCFLIIPRHDAAPVKVPSGYVATFEEANYLPIGVIRESPDEYEDELDDEEEPS